MVIYSGLVQLTVQHLSANKDTKRNLLQLAAAMIIEITCDTASPVAVNLSRTPITVSTVSVVK